MPADHLVLGARGESLAVKHLSANGYTILHTNYRCRFGEIDIIAKDGNCLVFIEVKTRRSTRFGHPAAAVTIRKQKQICRAAQDYLVRHKLMDSEVRFDVLSLILATGDNVQIEHLPGAFEYIG